MDAVDFKAVQAIPASELVDSLGVNVHLSFMSTPYGNPASVEDLVSKLGVRHLRDRLSPRNSAQWRTMKRLAARGVRFDTIMGTPTSTERPRDLIRVIETQMPGGVVESLEGANEWNLAGRANWANELRTHQTELWHAAKGSAVTKNLPVLAPALGLRRGFSELGDLSEVADTGNVHNYPGGLLPSLRIDGMVQAERQVTGSEPVVFTESGFHSALNTPTTHPGTPEGVAGVYAPRLLLDHMVRGVDRVYLYELIDEGSDSSLTDREAGFGLVRNDLTPKPAFLSLQRLLALAESPSKGFKPGSLDYAVGGAPADLQQLLLQRSDGTFVLLLWRDVSLYDPTTKAKTDVSSEHVLVRLRDAADFAVSRPSTRAAARETSGQGVTVDLGGDVVAVEIRPDSSDGNIEPVADKTAPGAPEQVRVGARRRAAVVRWAAPLDNGGSAVKKYRVRDKVTGKSVKVSGDSHRAVLKGLRLGSRVKITIKATNAIGYGKSSATIVARLHRG